MILIVKKVENYNFKLLSNWIVINFDNNTNKISFAKTVFIL